MTQIESEHNTISSEKPLNGKATTNRKGCCKRVSRILFSHIGLVSMVVVYVVLGGFLFEVLEQHEEIRLCEQGKGEESINIVTLRAKLLTYIQFNITSNPEEVDKDNETVANEKIEFWLQEFRSQAYEIKANYNYIGNDCYKPRWSLPGALLFAVTVITTIGYGNITPVTWEGQIVCVCYAIIGIPIFLMCLANISGVLGDMFRFAYSRICCRFCYYRKKKNIKTLDNKNKNIEKTIVEKITPIEYNSKLNYEAAIDKYVKIQRMQTNQNVVKIDDPQDYNKYYQNQTIIEDANEDGIEEQEEKVAVPLTVTMIIITAYIAIGALLFHEFEQWTLVQSGYFCFITLATIGFGDFVPGQRDNDPYAAPKLMLGAIYVLFGMSICGMCFDLMQEEIIAKFTWLGKKFGIVEEDQTNLEDELINESNTDKEKFNNFNEEISNERKINNLNDQRSSYSPSIGKIDGQLNKFRSTYLENVIQRQQFKS